MLITYGETMVLVTAVSQDERPGLDFFPLTCEFFEKTYAAGKIPGGFFKREARQRDEEILTCRLMDRPLRPLFPDGFKKDTQIIATVLSSDKLNKADVLAMTGASAALHLSDIPWNGPLAGVRVGRIDGEFVAYPTVEQLTNSDMDMVVACSRDAIVMVEGGAAEATETEIIDALMFAHETAQPILDLIEKIRAAVGKPKREFVAPQLDEAIKRRVSEIADPPLASATRVTNKKARYDGYSTIKKQVSETLLAELGPEKYLAAERLVKAEFEERKAHIVRSYVLDEGKRIDGRDGRSIRPIACEAGLLPRVHGSALFQRGETQAIVTTTLGTSTDEQKIDSLMGESWKRFYLHYNFPPFSTGETKPMRGPGRREIGHGALAERALSRMVPPADQFPYTIRIVSETLESNGSSSMAAVCGGCLSLMDAGVPIKAPVAGIAMGLIMEGDKYAILSDILGDEDHLGDMDFKVCGTARGVTAIQMDIKIAGLSRHILVQALEQARDGRLHILGKMLETLPATRPDLSPHAPRITTFKVKPDQIRLIIGPGGKTIKGIVDQTGVSIDLEDDGTVNVASADADAVRKALDIIKGLTAEPEVGATYKGTVKRVADFGAFVEILPNIDGLLHISEMAHHRVERVEDLFKEGDSVEVKVVSVERDGKIRLSRKELLPVPEGMPERPSRDRGPRDRPERGGDRFARPERGPRPERGEGFERPERGPRPEGGERGPRPEGFERPERGPRPEGGERGPRPERGEGFERPERGPRPEGGERGPRPEGFERPERGPRPERGEGFERPERGPRPEGGERGPRPEGAERGPRPERPERATLRRGDTMSRRTAEQAPDAGAGGRGAPEERGSRPESSGAEQTPGDQDDGDRRS
ncbi:Polyribonucleotide nucleotidyltransferase [Chondromyces apiculatus DSM 436]|uniref:Polyribonucleotide nucleotidyltransferase n=1 Tax=Chondromyces apiculatus DSM 436 TaxID=1192034 RepID=A0A017T7U3_9BACT|nr:Polyribonucleotide nucleotidyltransferase [Chondromyces apiculatus DSM 436]